MSFSSEAKNELCHVPLNRTCCARAEAYGVLLYCHTFDRREIRIITANDAFAQRLPKLFRRAFSLSFDHVPPEGAAGKRTFLITAPEKILSILEVFGQESAVSHHINYGMLETDCCRQSFFRGAFLAGGSVTDPDKRYHLELLTSHPSVSREAFNLMLEMGFAPKDAVRGGGLHHLFQAVRSHRGRAHQRSARRSPRWASCRQRCRRTCATPSTAASTATARTPTRSSSPRRSSSTPYRELEPEIRARHAPGYFAGDGHAAHRQSRVEPCRSCAGSPAPRCPKAA